MVTGKRLGAAALLLATFVLGAAAGRGSYHWTARRDVRDQRTERRSDDRGAGSNRYVDALQRELNLSPAQKDTVQAILRKWEPSMRSAWDTVREGARLKFDSLRSLVRADITRILTDDQKSAYQKWAARNDSVARKREKENNRAR
jgi:hypothetical protein